MAMTELARWGCSDKLELTRLTHIQTSKDHSCGEEQTIRMHRQRGWYAAAVVGAVATTGVLAAGPGFGADGTGPVTVTVRADQPAGTIAPGAVGVNTPIWNGDLLDQPPDGLVRQAGINLLEFNSGGVSDLYHWRDGSLSPDPNPAGHPSDYDSLIPAFSFDQFEQTARTVDAGTLVHVNYGTGTPAEAAAWVRYANIVKHDHVNDWAIGEEVWGNGGIDGIDFEPDAHPDKTPTAYADNVVAYAKAMKAVDPGIRVGVEVTGRAVGRCCSGTPRCWPSPGRWWTSWTSTTTRSPAPRTPRYWRCPARSRPAWPRCASWSARTLKGPDTTST
jgi:hypothetical protein